MNTNTAKVINSEDSEYRIHRTTPIAGLVAQRQLDALGSIRGAVERRRRLVCCSRSGALSQVCQVNVEAADDRGPTALQHAAAYGRMKALSAMLDHGANIGTLENFDRTLCGFLSTNRDLEKSASQRGQYQGCR